MKGSMLWLRLRRCERVHSYVRHGRRLGNREGCVIHCKARIAEEVCMAVELASCISSPIPNALQIV